MRSFLWHHIHWLLKNTDILCHYLFMFSSGVRVSWVVYQCAAFFGTTYTDCWRILTYCVTNGLCFHQVFEYRELYINAQLSLAPPTLTVEEYWHTVSLTVYVFHQVFEYREWILGTRLWKSWRHIVLKHRSFVTKWACSEAGKPQVTYMHIYKCLFIWIEFIIFIHIFIYSFLIFEILMIMLFVRCWISIYREIKARFAWFLLNCAWRSE